MHSGLAPSRGLVRAVCRRCGVRCAPTGAAINSTAPASHRLTAPALSGSRQTRACSPCSPYQSRCPRRCPRPPHVRRAHLPCSGPRVMFAGRRGRGEGERNGSKEGTGKGRSADVRATGSDPLTEQDHRRQPSTQRPVGELANGVFYACVPSLRHLRHAQPRDSVVRCGVTAQAHARASPWRAPRFPPPPPHLELRLGSRRHAGHRDVAHNSEATTKPPILMTKIGSSLRVSRLESTCLMRLG